MRRVVDWLRRLASAGPDDLKEAMFRAIVPGDDPFVLTDTVIKVEPLGPMPMTPGETDHPSLCTLLRFFDTEGLRYDSYLIAAELGSLLSLASDRRIEVALELPVTVEGRPETHFLSYGAAVDRRMHGPLPSDTRERFVESLSRLPSLGSTDLTALSAALKLHYGSAVLARRDFRSAYLLLVAALEVLSREYGAPPDDWGSWEEGGSWDAFMESLGLAVVHQAAIRDRLLANRHLRLKATFRDYGASALPESFWSEAWEEWHYPLHLPAGTWGEPTRQVRPMTEIVPLDRILLSQALGKTYDTRSGLVHRGEELSLLDTGLGAGVALTGSAAIPYAVLRKIVVALIRKELTARSTSSALPDIRFI